MNGQLEHWNDVAKFMLAGNATITIRSMATGTRYTYKVRKAEPKHNQKLDEAPWFVSLLSGPDNENDFAYMGIIRLTKQTMWTDPHYVFNRTKASRLSDDAGGVVAWMWFFKHFQAIEGNGAGTPAAQRMQVFHEGRCGRCGRKLTVPESVMSGIGPECAQRMAA